MILVALAQNAGLLLALVAAFDLLMARGEQLWTLRQKILAGFATGAIAVTMIAVAVPFGAGIIFDTRSVLLAMAGLFLGPLPTLIAIVMASAFRLALGGAATTGVAVIVASGTIGILWNRRHRETALENITSRELYVFGLVVHVVMLGLMVSLPGESLARVWSEVMLPVMVVHPLATLLMGLLFVQRLRFHRAIADLAASESRFRLLAENASDVIFRYDFAPIAAFTYVSPSATAFTGYSPEEFYADRDLGVKLVSPHDRPLLEASLRGEVPDGQPVILRWIRKDGTILWTEQRNRTVRNELGEVSAVEGIVRDITVSTQADVMIRMALKATNQGLYDFDLHTGAVRVSEEYWRMLGYDDFDFAETYDTWFQRVHPDEREDVVRHLRDFIEGRASHYREEFRMRTRSGDWVWVLSLASIVSRDAEGKPERIIGTHTDTTALKSAEHIAQVSRQETERLLAGAEESRRALLSLVEDQQIAERQLREAERELRRLTEILEATQAAAQVGGWTLEVPSRALLWSEETYRIHDTTPEQYVPSLESARSFFTPESLPVVEEILRDAIDRGVSRSAELELISAAGVRKWVHFASSVTTDEGQVVRVTCAIQDITARVRAERERLELMAQLHQAQKLDSLGSLAGGVAHDLNNVLAAILSSAEAHRRKLEDGDPIARALDTIATACVRGRSVVRSLLYFARPEIDRRGPVDLNAVVREIADLLDRTTLKRIRFRIDLADRLPAVDGDMAALTHALMNVCINAVDAMPDGGELSIRTQVRPDGGASIHVRDTGEGMTPEIAARAVEPFFTTKTVGKGTGLGLAMVYGAVRAHGGTLTINSAPGEGTEVVLTFPAVTQEAGTISSPASKGERMLASPLTILLVDDDELIREGFSALLEMDGHDVSLAASGEEALAKIRDGVAPDLVILDVNMPGLTGPQTLDRLLEMRPDQRVLLASGFGDDAMLRATESRPNVMSIQKPFTIEDLEAKLRSG